MALNYLGRILTRWKTGTIEKEKHGIPSPMNTENMSFACTAQNQGIHHTYIFPRFLCETASAIKRRACPSTARGREGAAPTPTTTPCSRASILLMARCNFQRNN